MDTIIENLEILDGGGGVSYRGSLGMDRGKLAVFPGGAHPAAREIVDGAGLTAVPGLIDAHSHGDLTLISDYGLLSKLSQGITTQIAGQCGATLFPMAPQREPEIRSYVSGIIPQPELPEDISPLRNGESFFAWLKGLDSPLHTYCFTGHGTLRLAVMGSADRAPSKGELAEMEALLRQAMRNGALGLSAGLVYAPGCYAKNDELLSLLRVVSEEGGAYACHPRSEGDYLIEARAESIRLAQEAKVPLCLSHLKAAGRSNWGKVIPVLAESDRAAEAGLDVLIDNYPYLAGCTALNVSLPQRCFSQGMPALVTALRSPGERERIRREMEGASNFIGDCGGFENVMVGACPLFHDGEGLSVADYAKQRGMDAFDAYCDILIRNQGLGLGIYFHMCQEDMEAVFRHPRTVLGTDGLLGAPDESPHPRAFGSTARAYRLLTQTLGLTPGMAVRRMSGLPADHFRLQGKGYLRSGFDGDVTILDLADFTDRATYQHGNLLTSGVKMVYSMGRLVYREGMLV